MRRSIRVFGFAAALAATAASTHPAAAIPALVVDLVSGDVLYQEQATQPWYPASLTKLMTVYVTLSAVRAGRISLDTPLVVSTRAAQMPPSKMGFVPGTQVTLGNALKMMMVKSANDIAITIAEGVSGSVEAFADEMNVAASRIGLQQSHFVNPNGLPDPRHYSSARDMAVIAQTLYRSFPDQASLFSIGALSLDGQIIANHNNLIGRYPGIDGMKTGFTCAAGFNVVATADRGGRHLAAIVMGAPNVAQRTMKTAVLLDRGFAGIDMPSGSLMTLPSTSTSPPPDMRDRICRARSKAVAEITADINRLEAPLAGLGGGDVVPASAFAFAGSLSRPAPMAMHMAEVPRPVPDLTPIYVGPAPGYAGPVAQVRPPHTPVGTELPPETASAYAATLSAAPAAGTPLAPDINALPLNVDTRRRRAAKASAAAKAAKPAEVAVLPPSRPEPAKAVAAKHGARTHLAKVEAAEPKVPAAPLAKGHAVKEGEAARKTKLAKAKTGAHIKPPAAKSSDDKSPAAADGAGE